MYIYTHTYIYTYICIYIYIYIEDVVDSKLSDLILKVVCLTTTTLNLRWKLSLIHHLSVFLSPRVYYVYSEILLNE